MDGNAQPMTCMQAHDHHAQHGPGEHVDTVVYLIEVHKVDLAHCPCLDLLQCRTVHPETGDYCRDG